MWDRMTKGMAACAGAVMGLWCALPAGVQTLAAFMAADYATGLVCAWRGVSHKSESGTLSSKAGFDGLLRKGMMALVVLIAWQLDRAMNANALHNAAVCFYIANEGISILENTALLGVPWPKRLRDALDVLGERGESE